MQRLAARPTGESSQSSVTLLHTWPATTPAQAHLQRLVLHRGAQQGMQHVPVGALGLHAVREQHLKQGGHIRTRLHKLPARTRQQQTRRVQASVQCGSLGRHEALLQVALQLPSLARQASLAAGPPHLTQVRPSFTSLVLYSSASRPWSGHTGKGRQQ